MKLTVGLTRTTVRFEVLLTVPEEAVMIAVPPPAPEARPVELTVAIARFDDDHVTELVMFAVLPSV